jgi:Zn-dependent metalloprotease
MPIHRGTCRSGQAPHGELLCSIAPPDVLARVAERGSPEEREAAIRTLVESVALRARRNVVSSLVRDLNADLADFSFMSGTPAVAAEKRRTVYDAQHGGHLNLPGRRERGEGDSRAADPSVNEAYDGSGATYDFYLDVLKRNSIDGEGLELVSSVHYLTDYDNAGWNGVQMVYGDGSGRMFAKGAFTKAIDVIGHELTHGVTQYTAGLVYHKQPGALNESMSDVFGSLVKQYGRGQTADQADWLLGEGILGSAVHGEALRSMKAPGTAFDLDRQPAHMDDYQDLPDDDDPRNDHGGVHINSGIPNRAFYLAATAIGGYAWEKAGRIWYVTLTERLRPFSEFPDAAEATVTVAGELFGDGSQEQEQVRDAWRQVGVLA